MAGVGLESTELTGTFERHAPQPAPPRSGSELGRTCPFRLPRRLLSPKRPSQEPLWHQERRAVPGTCLADLQARQVARDGGGGPCRWPCSRLASLLPRPPAQVPPHGALTRRSGFAVTVHTTTPSSFALLEGNLRSTVPWAALGFLWSPWPILLPVFSFVCAKFRAAVTSGSVPTSALAQPAGPRGEQGCYGSAPRRHHPSGASLADTKQTVLEGSQEPGPRAVTLPADWAMASTRQAA